MTTASEHDYFLPNLTTEEVRDLPDKEQAVVILPLAAIEQHGPHLPLYTDSLIAGEVLQRALRKLPSDFPAWCLPLMPYGKSTEHAAFAGTITLSAEGLIRALKEIAASVARAGFRRFVILNAHGGNTEIVDFVLRDIRHEQGLLTFALHTYLRVAVPEEGLSEDERTYGIHAGDVETSILLASNPDLVRQELAPASMPIHLKTLKHPPFMGPLTFGWLTEDITRDGALGDATTAEAARGERYLERAAEQVAELLEEVRHFRFDPN
jgi:creatinine amidohydrolase